jgi:hypothetical protein
MKIEVSEDKLTSIMQRAPVDRQACTSLSYFVIFWASRVPPSLFPTRYCHATGKRKAFRLSSLTKCFICPRLKRLSELERL